MTTARAFPGSRARAIGPAAAIPLAALSLAAWGRDLAASTPNGQNGSSETSEIRTHLYALESTVIPLGRRQPNGGAMANLGDDLLVVSGAGNLVLITPEGAVEPLAERVPMNVSAWVQDETFTGKESSNFRTAGILLKELSPERFELFVTHHYFTGECVRFRLSSTILERPGTATRSGSWRTIFEADPCFESWLSGDRSAGRMLRDGPDHLLVVIGDHARDGWLPWANRAPVAADPDSHLGKLVRVTIATGEVEILAAGLRNPQGLARDDDGALWAVEHGPRGGDELNLLETGRDYGWPHVSYGVDYGRKSPLPMENETVGGHDGFHEPVFSWVPSIAPTSIVVNDERRFPLWKDDFLIASLKARSLLRVRRSGTAVKYVEQIEIGAPIRDMTWTPDGRLAILYAYGATHIGFLSRSTDYCGEESRQNRDVYAAHCAEVPEESASAGGW